MLEARDRINMDQAMKAIFITVPLLTLMVAPSFAQPLKIPMPCLVLGVTPRTKGELCRLAAPLNSNGVPDCGADYYLLSIARAMADMR